MSDTVTQNAYNLIFQRFDDVWTKKPGQELEIKTSYGGSGTRKAVEAPFRTATLVDPPVQVDFSTVTTANDVVTILSTEPLTTDEQWHAIEPGSSMLWCNGELHGQHRS